MNISNEYEFIFIEIYENLHKLVIGEMYRVPVTNAQICLQRYQKILHMLSTISGNVMIGEDQN